MTNGGKVHPDLMGSAGLGKDFEERGAVKFLNPLPTGDRGPPPPRPSGHPLSRAGMSSDGRINQAFILAEFSVDNGQIDFFYGPVLKLFGQVMKSLILFGDDHHAGGIFVQSMHNPRPYDAIDTREIFAIIE
jgi:hypothetical protein